MKLLLSGVTVFKGELIGLISSFTTLFINSRVALHVSDQNHPHTSYPGPVVCLTRLKLAILEQSLTMKTFFSSTVWKRP